MSEPDGDEYELRAPSSEPLYAVDHPGERKIVSWRADCFERMGFPTLTAVALATRRDVDRERVTNMIRAGATPSQVVAIVL